MAAPKRSDYELRKLADWWLDVSKLILASFAIKLLEPGSPKLTFQSTPLIGGGLIFSLICVKLGLNIAKKVKSYD